MSATTPTPAKRTRRQIKKGEAYASHCRFVAGLLKAGVQLPPDAAAVHAQQLLDMAEWMDGTEEPEDQGSLNLPTREAA